MNNNTKPEEIEEIFNLNKLVMRCPIESHEMQRQKYICMDSQCQITQKEGCADCFLDQHLNHERMDIEQFIKNLKNKYINIDQLLQQSNKDQEMNEFKKELDDDIEKQFSDIKTQILNKFDEFKIDLKAHLTKKIQFKPIQDSINPYIKQINTIKQNSQQQFQNLNAEEVIKCIEFYNNNEQIQKQLEDSSSKIQKIKVNIQRNKTKYFDRLKNLFSDILQDHSDNSTHNNDSTSEEITEQQSTPSNSTLKNKNKKRVSFAQDLTDSSPNKEIVTQKFSTPRKKLKVQQNDAINNTFQMEKIYTSNNSQQNI